MGQVGNKPPHKLIRLCQSLPDLFRGCLNPDAVFYSLRFHRSSLCNHLVAHKVAHIAQGVNPQDRSSQKQLRSLRATPLGLDKSGYGFYHNHMVIQPYGYRNNLDATFAALADPTRRAILARLATGEASVAELAEPFAMSQPAISKHLKVLERAGLVSQGQDAQRRPRRLETAPLQEATEWLESYRQLWSARFDELDKVIEELKRKEKVNGSKRK